MANLRKELSNLPALIIFEAVTRSDNFSRAAEDLGITRVSVSRQIAELEAALGTKLFRRDHRKVTLTQAGRQLEAAVNPALVAIANSLQQIRREAGDHRLSVTTTTAFATYWLMPRLIDFGAKHPEVELNLVVTDRYLDLEAENIDVAIRYTDLAPSGDNVTNLFRERLYAVYSPKYHPKTTLSSPADLLDEQLLHLSGSYRAFARWPFWFQELGLPAPAEKTGVVVNTYITMLQAALEGQGVALAGFPLVDSYVADGSLKIIEGFPQADRECFYLIDRTAGRPDGRAFCDWVRAQSALCKMQQD